MKKFLFLAIFSALDAIGQTPDSLKKGFKWKNAPVYVRVTPLAIYTGPGKYADRISQHLEIGKTFNILDVGLAYGRSSLRPDTSHFVEAKATLDVGNIGIFANETTVGVGKLFDRHGSLMLEISYNIFAQVSTHWGFGVSTGFYDFSNENSGISNTLFGLNVRYGLQRTDDGGILGLTRNRPRQFKGKKVRRIKR